MSVENTCDKCGQGYEDEYAECPECYDDTLQYTITIHDLYMEVIIDATSEEGALAAVEDGLGLRTVMYDDAYLEITDVKTK